MKKKQNQQFLYDLLEDALKYAEMLSHSSSNQLLKSTINEELIPSLYIYKTFLELKKIMRTEVDIALRASVTAASKIETINKETVFLLSKVKILREETLRLKKTLQ
ncbi:MAG: hypothetical protein CL764_00630 [Chloroflexi bacterium]|nr:hypothetical protein [Chloroflexota bacterium]|tara:strand:+ start:4975 stop:5292 length:318 start_codon:yes stop_codon:yes gene_type:complete